MSVVSKGATEIAFVQPMILNGFTQFSEEVVRDNLANGLRFPFVEEISKKTYLLRRFGGLLRNSALVYFPVHLVITIIKFFKSKEKSGSILKKTLKDFLKSSLYAAVFAMSIPTSYTCLKHIYPRVKSTWMGFLISFVYSMAIFIESRSRWGEISLWVLSQWFEGFSYSCLKRRILPAIPHWHKYVLMVAMAIISYTYYNPEDFEETDKLAPNKAKEGDTLKSRPDRDSSRYKRREDKLDTLLRFILGSKQAGKIEL